MFQREAIPTKREMEAKLTSVGDYVKMDYLTACLKKNLDFDTRKFALAKLAEIYEPRGMHAEAAKLMNASAEINTTFDGKIKDFMKAMELFIKSGNFDDSDASFAKALACGNERQKAEIKNKRKEFYATQALAHLNKDKRTNAMKTYERFLSIADLTPGEKGQAQKNLLALYEKLGKVREFYNLKKMM